MDNDKIEEVEPTETPSVETDKAESPKDKPEPAISSGNKFKKLWHSYLAKKKLSIPLTILAIVAIILAIPVSRYEVLGLFLKENINISIVDGRTGQAVTSAEITMGGVTAKSDGQGKATVKVKVGSHNLQITKKYYADYNQKVTVTLSGRKNNQSIKLNATGRLVPFTVTNKINGQPVANATLKISGTEAKTDKDGTATVALPADQAKLNGILSATGYNDSTVSLTITEQKDSKNNFKVVPAGKIYFLSKASGKIDVVKTNLDGSDRQTVLAGTGKEEDTGTVLLASRDWKYLALLSQRDSNAAKLYLIDTTTDKLTTMDEGNASFTLTGWEGHYFVYEVNRIGKQLWQPKQYAIKTFNADTNKLTLLDETTAAGTSEENYAAETFGDLLILPNSLVYTENWDGLYPDTSNSPVKNKKAQIISVQPDGSQKVILKQFGQVAGADEGVTLSLTASQYEPSGIYFFYNDNNKVYKYENGTIAETKDLSQDSFFGENYNTYLASPSSKYTFWYEERDGKNTLFVGDANGKNGKVIGNLTDYVTYGWYTDNYLLVSKGDSQLYIMGNGPIQDNQPLKISDYHKPDQIFFGYGGGYGGL